MSGKRISIARFRPKLIPVSNEETPKIQKSNQGISPIPGRPKPEVTQKMSEGSKVQKGDKNVRASKTESISSKQSVNGPKNETKFTPTGEVETRNLPGGATAEIITGKDGEGNQRFKCSIKDHNGTEIEVKFARNKGYINDIYLPQKTEKLGKFTPMDKSKIYQLPGGATVEAVERENHTIVATLKDRNGEMIKNRLFKDRAVFEERGLKEMEEELPEELEEEEALSNTQLDNIDDVNDVNDVNDSDDGYIDVDADNIKVCEEVTSKIETFRDIPEAKGIADELDAISDAFRGFQEFSETKQNSFLGGTKYTDMANLGKNLQEALSTLSEKNIPEGKLKTFLQDIPTKWNQMIDGVENQFKEDTGVFSFAKAQEEKNKEQLQVIQQSHVKIDASKIGNGSVEAMPEEISSEESVKHKHGHEHKDKTSKKSDDTEAPETAKGTTRSDKTSKSAKPAEAKKTPTLKELEQEMNDKGISEIDYADFLEDDGFEMYIGDDDGVSGCAYALLKQAHEIGIFNGNEDPKKPGLWTKLKNALANFVQNILSGDFKKAFQGNTDTTMTMATNNPMKQFMFLGRPIRIEIAKLRKEISDLKRSNKNDPEIKKKQDRLEFLQEFEGRINRIYDRLGEIAQKEIYQDIDNTIANCESYQDIADCADVLLQQAQALKVGITNHKRSDLWETIASNISTFKDFVTSSASDNDMTLNIRSFTSATKKSITKEIERLSGIDDKSEKADQRLEFLQNIQSRMQELQDKMAEIGSDDDNDDENFNDSVYDDLGRTMANPR